MSDNQHDFLQFALSAGVLKFGEFKLKSGRISPYFFNTGLFNDGASLAMLGRFYATAIVESGVEFDTLFGPAYKGIPLVSAVAIALSDVHGLNYPWVFNRKESKDHGEGGLLVGAALAGRVLVIDDVITAGTAIRESLTLISQHEAVLAGVCVSIDRQEQGQGELSAIQEVKRDSGAPVITIASLDTLVSFLEQDPHHAPHLPAVLAYRRQYGT